ncbi:MAG: lipopolysaccharide transport system permease protein [Acidimicrobiaceae bacterium]|jgi:ABC-2 type transport system permease protein/lipopolysaccharide transport system permease protein
MVEGSASSPAGVADQPPPEIVFRRRLHLVTAMKELWAARELVGTLTERNLRSRYKQTFLGFAWSLITPVTLMVVFTVFLRRVAHIETGGIPYPIFAYVGLLPWSFFSGAVSASSQVIVQNNALLNKIYCPREVFPISTVTSAAVDTACAMVALLVLFAVNGFMPTAGVVWVPMLTVVLVLFTVGVCLLLSALTVYVRDLRYGVTIILQLGLFATPVAYSLNTVVPKAWQPVYAACNPLGPVIQGFRDTVLVGDQPEYGLLGIAAVSSLVWVALGYVVFKRMETGFSDVA